jgi:predicted nucleotide-binding protein
VAQVPIEILTAGALPSDHLERAVSAANTLQSEFRYSFFPPDDQADFRAYVFGRAEADDALDQIDKTRKREGGYHPYCVGFIDSELEGRDGYKNIFGSDRPSEGLAVFTIADVPDLIIPSTRLSAYFLYYLAKCALSFLAPSHKNHSDTRRCPYDQKIKKREIIESMRARALCDGCRGALRSQPTLTARQILAMERLFAACGDLLREDPNEPTTVDPRPRLFIGSSKEGLPIAEALKQSLESDLVVEIWNQGTVFGLGDSTLEALEAAVLAYDFGLFVFTPDDQLNSRGEVKAVARDNVIFELGLFVGKLTRRRAFVLRPTGSTIALPSDLAGITTAAYECGQVGTSGYLNSACDQIRAACSPRGDCSTGYIDGRLTGEWSRRAR